jgi:hypothetical protein
VYVRPGQAGRLPAFLFGQALVFAVLIIGFCKEIGTYKVPTNPLHCLYMISRNSPVNHFRSAKTNHPHLPAMGLAPGRRVAYMEGNSGFEVHTRSYRMSRRACWPVFYFGAPLV